MRRTKLLEMAELVIVLLPFMIAQSMSKSTPISSTVTVTSSASTIASSSSSSISTATEIQSSSIASTATVTESLSATSTGAAPISSTSHAVNLALVLGLVLGLLLPLLLVIMLIVVRYFKLEKNRHRGRSDDTAPIILSRRNVDEEDDDAWAARPGPYHDATSEPFMKSFDFGERPLEGSSSLPQYDPAPPRNAAPAIIPTHIEGNEQDTSPISPKSARQSIFKEVL